MQLVIDDMCKYMLKFGEIFKGGKEELPDELKEVEDVPMAADEYKSIVSDEQFRMFHKKEIWQNQISFRK